MSKVTLIKIAKKLKRNFKILTGNEMKPYVSYSRRINFVKTNERICAMTFDDGPTNTPSNPCKNDLPLTQILIETLEKYNAKGTFDVIGTTENNYPDAIGKLSTPSWSGVKYDHYPSFSNDALAGAKNTPQLIERIIQGGHQITNHTFSHILYGKKNMVYSKRKYFNSFEDVQSDLLKLHSLMEKEHKYEMKYSRPPHYVDKISRNLTSYDLYSLENYLYLGASFDGAGWLPSANYQDEVWAMTKVLKEKLEKDPDAMCGQIIFQKDGFNMAQRSPVADGLEEQLKILQYYGYNVVTVEELVNRSPFSDIDDTDKDFELFKHIAENHAVVFNDNFLRPDKRMTLGELALLIAPKKESVNARIYALLSNRKKLGPLPARHPYSGAVNWAVENELINIDKKNVNSVPTPRDFIKLADYFELSKLEGANCSRRSVLRAMKNK